MEKITNVSNMLHSYYCLNQNIVKVKQYTLQGGFVAEYVSLSEARRETGYSISGISLAINNKIKTYKGFVWKKE